MTDTERDKWESNAIGLAAGAIGASLMIWLGADPWMPAAFYLLLGVALTVWANRGGGVT